LIFAVSARAMFLKILQNNPKITFEPKKRVIAECVGLSTSALHRKADSQASASHVRQGSILLKKSKAGPREFRIRR
jgi:hypothetical protein